MPDSLRRAALVCATAAAPWCAGCHNPASPGGGPPILLPANIADPSAINAVSQFNACVGHPFPLPSSPTSAKNYFWPTSTNFSSTDKLDVYAACDGTTGQNASDTNDPTSTRGATIHLWCDGSSTGLRYFHLNAAPGALGRHVSAGEKLGFAAMLGPGQAPSTAWQFSSNFDVAVFDGDDGATANYFAKLGASAFAAWGPRGVTSVAQTAASGGSCTSYSSNVGDAGILSLSPLQ